jgi:hypothetical protein
VLQRALLTLACTAAFLATAGGAWAQESKIEFKVLGFNADAKTMLVGIEDVDTGLALRLYDVESGQPAKKSVLVPYIRVDGVKTIKEARKKYKITDPGVEDTIYLLDPADETKTLSFFGLMASKERFVLAATDKKKLGKIKDVPVQKDEETGILGTAALKSVFWTTDRKTMIAVVKHKLDTGNFSREVDEFHAIRFTPDVIRWVEQDKPKEDEKPKEEEKKKEEKGGWWPF